MDAKISIVAKAQRNSNSSTVILQNLETLAIKIGQIIKQTGEGTFQTRTKNIGLAVSYISKVNLAVYAREATKDLLEVVITNTTDGKKGKSILSEIGVPEETFLNDREIVQSYCFRDDTFFITQSRLLNPNIDEKQIVQSTVLSAAIGEGWVSYLVNPIKLKFRKIREINAKGNNSCQYWNFTLSMEFLFFSFSF